jgi:tetratricopeptide (TPR) repeat protein
MTMPPGQELKDTGLAHFRAGRFEEAITALAQAQQAFAAEGNRMQAAECANDHGVAARQAAHFEEAEAALSQARQLFQELGDLKGQGQVLGNLGSLAESRNRNGESAQFYKEAIELFNQAGASDLAAQTWQALSRLRMKQGKWFQALGAYDAGLDGIKNPTPTQRLLRRLMGTTRRLMGG